MTLGSLPASWQRGMWGQERWGCSACFGESQLPESRRAGCWFVPGLRVVAITAILAQNIFSGILGGLGA